MTHDRTVYRCARCGFVMQPEEVRVLAVEYPDGWVHPVCLRDGEVW